MTEPAPPTPAAVIPAEWGPHGACLTAWPASFGAWGEHLAAAQVEFAHFVREFAAHAGEWMLVLSPGGAAPLELRDLDGAASFLPIPYGDVWLRDIGPVYRADGAALAFEFNGWGGKYRYAHDPEVAQAVASWLDSTLVRAPLVAEGGALESDGAGTYLTTRSCLLNPNRNPGLGEAEVDALLGRFAGARQVVWLDDGLVGDHTDGHIDNLARFVSPATVVCTRSEPNDPNRDVHARVEDSLRAARDADGVALTVHTLPSPGPVPDEDGAPMPASYMNFYIANAAVFVPTYGVDSDAVACARLGELFPGRRIVAIPSRAILTGGGSLHCVTQQIPEGCETP